MSFGCEIYELLSSKGRFMEGQGGGHARILLKGGKEEEKRRRGGYVWAGVLVIPWTWEITESLEGRGLRWEKRHLHV
jgi:hypothetical protein